MPPGRMSTRPSRRTDPLDQEARDPLRKEVEAGHQGVRRVPPRRREGQGGASGEADRRGGEPAADQETEGRAAIEEYEIRCTRSCRLRLGLDCTVSCPRREGSEMGEFRGALDARRDNRDRGRRRRAERDGDDRRGRRPVRPVTAAPAAGPCRPRRTKSWCFLFADPTTPTARSAWPQWPRRPTASCSPRRTWRSAGRGGVRGERQSGWSEPEARAGSCGRADRPRPSGAPPRRSSTATPTSGTTRSSRDEVEDLPGRRRRVPLQVISERRSVGRPWL